MENNYNKAEEIDLVEIYHLIKAKILIIALTGIILAAVAGIYNRYTTTPSYTSSSQLYILTKSNTSANLSDIQMGAQLSQDFMLLVKSRPVVNQVIEQLDLNITYEQLTNMISVTNPSDTRLIVITANYSDAYIAKRIADEFAEISAERIALIMDIDKPSIVEEGKLPTYPSNNNTLKYSIVVGGLGSLAATGFIVLLFLMNNNLKSEEDIERYLGLSTLALIPVTTYLVKQSTLELAHKKKKSQKRLFGGRLKKVWIKLNIFNAKKWTIDPGKHIKP